MVNVYCISSCTTGYGEVKKKSSLFKFPKDMTITKKWIQSIGKKDFIPSSNSRICSKHFMQEDFKKTSNDSNV